LKADREVVLVAVEQSGNALEHADDSLKADRDFLLAAAKAGSKFATMYADDSLMTTLSFCSNSSSIGVNDPRPRRNHYGPNLRPNQRV